MAKKTLNPIFIKNAYPPFLIDKVIKNYLDYKFSSNQIQLKDKSDIHYFHTISETSFRNLAKGFV